MKSLHYLISPQHPDLAVGSGRRFAPVAALLNAASQGVLPGPPAIEKCGRVPILQTFPSMFPAH